VYIEFLEILRCPKTGQKLVSKDPVYRDDQIYSALLVSEDGRYSYPVRDFIPRFVPESNYADNFGMQWNKFRQTQLDSYSGHPIPADRFWKATGWKPEEISGRWVLDVGCGAGRFAEIALEAGAKVVALDYSNTINACFDNLKHHPNLHLIRGDIYALPFPLGPFPFVYSLGVLQHTPDVGKALAALPPMVTAKVGRLCADVYWKRLRTMLHAKYLVRPITKRLPQKTLFRLLKATVPSLLKITQLIGRVPLIGKYLKKMIPVADYTGVYPLDEYQLAEWTLIDTFDILGPQYDSPQIASRIRQWMENAGLKEIDVLQASLLVVRGVKP